MDNYIVSVLYEDMAKEICSWKYDGAYSVYNFSDWEEVVENAWGLSIKEERESDFIGISKDNVLVAFGRISSENEVSILGVGLKPSLCGQGYGKEIMRILIDESKRRYPGTKIALEVRAFNQRAIRCYESIGFRAVNRYLKNINNEEIEYSFMEYKNGEAMSMKQLKLKNEETVLIRPAIEADAKALVDYINAISGESDFLTFGPGEFGMSVEQEEKFLYNISKQNNAIYLIAEAGGKIVGSLNFSCGARPRIAHTGEFGVSVLKDYWGYGIGSGLIKYLIKWSKESGVVRKINLRVRTDNASAIHVYKKLGFIEEGVKTRDFLIKGKFYDSLFMGLAID